MVARPFRHEAETRQLSFDVHLDPNLGRSITTDSKRLQQVLKNLLSNAFKFTGQGGVRLNVSAAVGRLERRAIRCSARRRRWSRSRSPTPASAFRWRSRRSSSRRSSRPTRRPAANMAAPGLASPSAANWRALLGGEIHLRSAPDSGSSFTLYLPIKYVGPTHGAARRTRRASCRRPPVAIERTIEQIADDRLDIQPGDAILLIVEDDPHYARILIDLARDKGFKVLLGDARRRCARSCQAISADRGFARRVPARHAGLERAQPAQAESAHAAYPGADRHARRRPPARACARRVLLRHQADDARRAFPRRSPRSRSSRNRGAGGCWWSRTTRPSR